MSEIGGRVTCYTDMYSGNLLMHARMEVVRVDVPLVYFTSPTNSFHGTGGQKVLGDK